MPLVAEISWVLTYLAASGEHTPEIVSAGLLDKITVLVGEICDKDLENSQVVTRDTDRYVDDVTPRAVLIMGLMRQLPQGFSQ